MLKNFMMGKPFRIRKHTILFFWVKQSNGQASIFEILNLRTSHYVCIITRTGMNLSIIIVQVKYPK